MNINILIEKYFAGETNPEEEIEINKFLFDNPNNSSYDTIRTMMHGLEAASLVSTSKKIDFSFIDSGKKTFRYYLVAAIIILTVSTVLFVSLESNQSIIITNQNIVTNKDIAREGLGKAFVLASEQFGKAIGHLETIHLPERSINPLEKLELINKYYNTKRKKS